MVSWIFEHAEAEGGEEVSSTSSSTTSSIGKNSDWWTSESSDSKEDDEEEEVQSAYNAKQGFLDALEDALPIKKGLSEFYGGRSKSFACMDEAESLSSIKEIGKAENPYNRRHRNLMAFNYVWPKETVHGGRISKNPASRKRIGLSRCESITSNYSDSSLRSRVSTNNLLSLKLNQITVPRRSISLPDFLVHPRSTLFG